MCLKFDKLFTSFQIVHGVAWKEPNVNTFRVNHQATSSRRLLTVSQPPQILIQPLPAIFIVQVCSVFYQFLPTEKCFTFKRKVVLCAEKASNHASGKKYTVSDACVRHWQSINAKLVSMFDK
jgi:hypothetical protein